MYLKSASRGKMWSGSDSAELVDTMLSIAKVTPADYVIDLGSGDGRTVISAAKRGARALGIEYNPDMVRLSKGMLNRKVYPTELNSSRPIFMSVIYQKQRSLQCSCCRKSISS